jgi:hypothetical protein
VIELKVEGSVAKPTAIEGLDNVFICENEPLERLLFNRRLAGLDFVRACRESSVLFLKHLAPAIDPYKDDISELMVMTKGYYYWLHNAYELAFNRSLPINFVATNRVGVTEQGVSVRVHFANLDAATGTLIIGDTVASGETICAALEPYISQNSLHRLWVVSYAGTIVGAKRISAFCRARGIDVHFLFGLAAFGLAQNGFDISFLHNETISSQKYLEMAQNRYEGRPISVAGWDFGSQAQAPRKYQTLARVEANYWGMASSPLFPDPIGKIDVKLIEKETAAFRGRDIKLDEIE